MKDKVKVKIFKSSKFLCRKPDKDIRDYAVGHIEQTVWIAERDVFDNTQKLNVYTKWSGSVTMLEAACDSIHK